MWRTSIVLFLFLSACNDPDCKSFGLVRVDGMCVLPDGGVEAGTDAASDAMMLDAPLDACVPGDEVCNGRDDDCDGSVDEDALTFYADSDGDGAGDSDTVCEACNIADCGVGTWVEAGDDCDDGCAECAPGLEEVCDAQDNDCDASVDEGVTTTYYRDMDNDSYGDAEVSMDACAVPGGYVERAGDCDDVDLRANPDAEAFQVDERIGVGGFDFDCDGDETREHGDDVRDGCPGGAVCPPPFWDESVGLPGCGDTAALTICRTNLGGGICIDRTDTPTEVRCR